MYVLFRDLDLDAEPPPLPERNFSWSDIEDNDEEFCQSDNELDEPSTIDHQMVYSSVSWRDISDGWSIMV